MEIKISAATIIENESKILLVKELQDGKIVYNQPVGCLEANEDIQEAAIREVLEETGLEIKLSRLLGVYQQFFEKTQVKVIRFCFVGEVTGGQLNNINDEDVVEANFYSKEDLVTLRNRFRNPLVELCLNDYFSNKGTSTDSIHNTF